MVPDAGNAERISLRKWSGGNRLLPPLECDFQICCCRYGVLGQSGQLAPAQARSLGSGHPPTGGRGSPMAGIAAVTRIVSAKLQVPSLGTAAG